MRAQSVAPVDELPVAVERILAAVDGLPIADLKRAAVSREAEGGESVSVVRHFEELGPRPIPFSADHKLNKDMPIGRVHQVALGIFGQRVSDEPPATD